MKITHDLSGQLTKMQRIIFHKENKPANEDWTISPEKAGESPYTSTILDEIGLSGVGWGRYLLPWPW